MSKIRLMLICNILLGLSACSTAINTRTTPELVPSAAIHLAVQPHSPLLQPTYTIPPVPMPTVTPSPTVWPTPLPFEDSLLANNYSPDVERFPTAWVRVTNSSGGYSLDVPNDWHVSLYEDGLTQLYPPQRGDIDRIYIDYLLFEKNEKTDLIDWLDQWSPVNNQRVRMGQDRTFELVEFDSRNPLDSQTAYEHGDNTLIGQAYILTNGRMLLRLQTNGMSDLQDAILRHMAESVVFHEKAPSTLLQIYGSVGAIQRGDQPYYLSAALTLEEYLRLRRVYPLAMKALEARVDTGVTPSEMLQDPEVAEMYNDLLDGYSLRIVRADLARSNAPQSPLETPTALPSPSATIQRRSPELTATPTPTPYPPSALDDLALKHSGLTPFVIECSYNTPDCLVTFWYDDALWEDIAGAYSHYLRQRELNECRIGITQPRGGGTMISRQTLANGPWTVYSGVGGGIIYSGGADHQQVLALVGLPNSLDYREKNKGQCQLDIEDVLSTISVIQLAP